MTGFNLFWLSQSGRRGGVKTPLPKCRCWSAAVQGRENFLTILLTKVLYICSLRNQFYFINLTFSPTYWSFPVYRPDLISPAITEKIGRIQQDWICIPSRYTALIIAKKRGFGAPVGTIRLIKPVWNVILHKIITKQLGHPNRLWGFCTTSYLSINLASLPRNKSVYIHISTIICDTPNCPTESIFKYSNR